MSATFRFLQGGCDSVIPQLSLHLYEIFEGRFVVGVDGHPFASLRSRVDRVDPYREFASQVLPDDFEAEARRFAAVLRFRTVVVVAAALRMPPHRLDRVGPPIYKQLTELSCHRGRCR